MTERSTGFGIFRRHHCLTAGAASATLGDRADTHLRVALRLVCDNASLTDRYASAVASPSGADSLDRGLRRAGSWR